MRNNEAYWTGNRWRIDIQRDGMRKSFYSSVKGKRGKIEAEKKADRWLLGEDDNIRTDAMLDRWLSDLSLSASEMHMRQYTGYVRRYIAPEIQKKRINSVTEQDLQRIIDKAYHTRGLSYKSLVNIRGAINAFMKYCRMSRVSTLRPESLKIPKSAHRGEKKIAQPNDIRKLFEVSEGHYLNAYRFAVLTGIRVGELLSLRWEDISNGVVSIKRSINELGVMTQGKNRNANRSFKLSERAEKVLDEQQIYLKSIGLISPWVFPDEEGKICPQKRYRLTWYRFADANGISRITPYEMRHTFVSVADDLPEGLKKQVVGHSKSMDTEGVYGHQKKGDMERAAAYIEDAFDRILN